MDSSSSSSSNLNSSDYVAIVALVISIAALVTTIFQLLQQYLASADGYRRCASSVMGLWARGTKRRFRKSELRFEVIFETPVIFSAPPGNKRGPIKQAPIIEVDGTTESYKQSLTMMLGDNVVSNVHTADDERASWVTLLETLQKAEVDSREWEKRYFVSARGNSYDKPQYTINACMQKKTRSWDFMPPTIIKPYATTTICHLVEICAMLGMHWRQFKVEEGMLSAEGNGCMLTSTVIPALGILGSFSLTGAQSFEDRRVIPCLQLKELCFGRIPNILSKPLEDAEPLVVDNKDSVAKTMTVLGCSSNAVKTFLADHKLPGHNRAFMFSVTFEMIAMLAKPFRIRGSNLRMLPNPCRDSWSPNVGMLLGIRAFKHQLDMILSDTPPLNRHPLLILVANQFVDGFSSQILLGELDPDVRDAAHKGLDVTDEWLRGHIDKTEISRVAAAHISSIILQTTDLQQKFNNPLGTKEENLMEYYFKEIRVSVVMGEPTAGLNNARQDQPSFPPAQQDERGAIWIALIFRMWCWFLLHDFDLADKNIVPTNFYGSRMPLFIG